jgi:transcriptional antiterminator NusG
MAHRWYAVHTYSGYEDKVKSTLEERIKSLGKEELFSEILVPSERVLELIRGEKKTSSRRFFPGYILVKMDLNNETWNIVKDTPKVTSFIGGQNRAVAIPDEEIEKIVGRIREGERKPKPKFSFEKGDSIRVVDGPFSNFNGIVDEVKPDKGKLKVLVSIFGRPTPVELDFIQVTKN